MLISRNWMQRAIRRDCMSSAATRCLAAIGCLMPLAWRCASCAPPSCSAANWPQQQGRRARSPTRPTPGPSSIGCRAPLAEGRALSAAIRCPPLSAVFCRSTGGAHLAHLLAQRLPGRNRSAGAAQSWPIDPVRERPWALRRERPWALRTGGGITDANLSEGMAIGEEISPNARREFTASINSCCNIHRIYK